MSVFADLASSVPKSGFRCIIVGSSMLIFLKGCLAWKATDKCERITPILEGHCRIRKDTVMVELSLFISEIAAEIAAAIE